MTAIAQRTASVHPTPLPVFRRWLSEGWRGLIGWSAGLAAVVFLYLPLYPAMKSPELIGLMDSLPPELVRTIGYENITTGAGYAQATFFGLTGFFLITIASITWGGAFTGGAEESGRLELTLAHGVGRVQYALESALALLAKMLVLGVVAWLLIWAMNGPGELELDAGNLVAVTTAWIGLGLFSEQPASLPVRSPADGRGASESAQASPSPGTSCKLSRTTAKTSTGCASSRPSTGRTAKRR